MSAPADQESPSQLRQLSVLIAVNFIDMIGLMMVVPLLPFAATDLGASPETIGRMIAAFSIAQLLSAPIWGRVSDHYGRRPALLIGLTASTIAYVVFGLATTVWLLFLSRIVQGAGGGTTGVAQAYVADTIRPADRAKALGWLSAATSAGVVVGPTIGSLASHIRPEAPGLLAATLCAVNAFFAWKWLPESKAETPPHHDAKRKPVWHAAWMVLRHPKGPVPRFIWIYAVGMLAFTSLTAVLALFLKDEHGVSAKTIGYFFAYVGILSVVMRSLLLGPIVDRIGEVRAMRLGAALLVVGLSCYPLAGNIRQLAAVIPLVPIGTALLFPATTSLMSHFSPKAELGTTMGVAQTYAGISRVLAPLVATTLYQRLGHGTPFFVAAVIVALVSLLSFSVSHPATEPELAGAEESS